jgi:uncharacterized protein involved in outer membrane biogenesis
MQKKVMIGVGGVLLVLIVFIWQVVANLDSIVAGVIEDVGTETLKTKVSVSDVSIDLKAGKAGIAGLTIANPDGYSSAKLFDMEGIEVDLDIKSMSEEVLVIESIRIKNPKISFEGTASGGSNMQSLLDNIENAPRGESAAKEGKVLKLIINRFEFSGGLVHAISALKPGEELDLKLPAIKMSGIGRSQGGVTADVAIKQITDELLNAVIASAVKAGVNKALEEKKKSFMERLGKKLKGDG